ncbi:MAG: VIT1/CCC1 transporter family protein [Novosphingobium sp.]|nr:VIT1/CCC1 transporter family protein [Novosphingobium sp.]
MPATTATAPAPLAPDLARHAEEHYVTRSGWLRAAVLGANDGLLSTASLMVGVAAASSDPNQLLLTGVAGIAAGAMSMAAGEYVSVSSQADAEQADLERERRALEERPCDEQHELQAIYQQRGLDPHLAKTVAEELSRTDPLDAHARDELGITPTSKAQPIQAAIASAASFTAGGLAPLAAALAFPGPRVIVALTAVAVAMLVVLGALGAHLGGSPIRRGIVRVVVFGSLGMAVTAGVGRLFHIAA